ncbi:MAG TPA: transposase [Terriglobia bacterium]|nr:transposase [Terriglobia bacterium]
MPRQHHYYGLNHAHFITASTYRRARLFDSNRFRFCFVQALAELRSQQNFRLLGWVLMPEHFHLLLWPCEQANPSQIVQSLKERTAKFALLHLRRNAAHPWCAQMLKKLALPTTVHRPSTHRAWQRRFYDLNIWSEKKRQEKLSYMHGNPVKRGLVASSELWPWSSFRFYYLNDASLLRMDPPS